MNLSIDREQLLVSVITLTEFRAWREVASDVNSLDCFGQQIDSMFIWSIYDHEITVNMQLPTNA